MCVGALQVSSLSLVPLPLTILFAPSGDTAYIRMGKLKYETVAAEIDKALATASGN